MTPPRRRADMLRHNAHAVALYYWRARDAGMATDDVVVLIIDASDGFGLVLNNAIREALGPTQGFSAEQIAAHHAKRMYPTVLAAMLRKNAAALFDEITPDVASALRRDTSGGYVWVAVVAFGGTTLCAVPEPARPRTAGSA